MADKRLVEVGSQEFRDIATELFKEVFESHYPETENDERYDNEEGHLLNFFDSKTVAVKQSLIDSDLKFEELGLLTTVLYGTKVNKFSIRNLAKHSSDSIKVIRRILKSLTAKKYYYHKVVPIEGTRQVEHFYCFFENPERFDEEIKKLPDSVKPNKNNNLDREVPKGNQGGAQREPPFSEKNPENSINSLDEQFRQGGAQREPGGCPKGTGLPLEIAQNDGSVQSPESLYNDTISSIDNTNILSIISSNNNSSDYIENTIERNLSSYISEEGVVSRGGMGEKREEGEPNFIYSTQKTQKAQRLPRDWSYPRDYIHDWRDKTFPSLTNDELLLIEEEFKDFWQSSGMPNSKKLDWVGAFRNWVRTYMRTNKRYTEHITQVKQKDEEKTRRVSNNQCKFCRLHSEDPTRKRCPYHQVE